jgi:transcription antitermination protein NusB
MIATPSPCTGQAMKAARRRARGFAVQGLYQWLLTQAETTDIKGQMQASPGFDKADQAYFHTLLSGVIAHVCALSTQLTPYLDRPINQLSPVEHAVLLIGAYELIYHSDLPYRIVINEAVELAKRFGGADGYKYVNGVLDALAAKHR